VLDEPEQPEDAGDELPDSAIVVRGGIMLSDDLDQNIKTHLARFPDDPPTLSVAAHAEWDVAQICGAALFIRNRQIRTSTVGQIRNLRHDVVLFGRVPHCSLQLCAGGSDALYDDLRAVFSDPFPNPRFQP
jgi:hypothetical protein